ncbi:phasin family protein [Massilia sp. CMS3.1]|uniref:phasin family protein n=1 Tax=Massilia sp. CMS3.1 TaxID=3373083 RepID=UPI003EE45E1E
MTSLPEQFSAARQTQLDNGLNLMRTFSDQAFDQTSRIFALQFQASRTAIEQSSAAMRQLLAAREARDLLALGTQLSSQSEQQLHTIFDYGRELFSIAAGAKFAPLRSYSADAITAITTANTAAAQQTVEAAVASFTPARPEAAPAAPVAPTAAAAPETAVTAEPAPFNAPVAEPESAPAFVIVTSDIEPSTAPTAIAQAASEITDMSIAPPHPVAASVPVEVSVEIELPKVEPVDAAPPVANTTTTTKVTEIRGSKGRRKQN